MEDRIITFLNGSENLRKAIPQFIEAFVSFYGEELREEIEKKFSNTFFIGFQTPESIAICLEKLEDLKTKSLIEEIIKQTNSNLTVEDIIGHNYGGYSFRYPNSHSINEFINFWEQYKLGEIGRKEQLIKKGYEIVKRIFPNMSEEEYREIFRTKKIPEKYEKLLVPTIKSNIEYYLNEKEHEDIFKSSFRSIKPFLEKIDPTINILNFDEKVKEGLFEKINFIVEKYQEAKKEYDSYIEQFSSFYEQVEEANKNRELYLKEVFIDFIKENIDLIPEEKRKNLEEFYQNPSQTYIIDTYVPYIFGNSLNGTSGLDSFTEANDELLKSSKDKETIQYIQRKRIEFFKKNGLDLGDDYDAYVNSTDAKKIWPKKERVKSFFESKEKFINIFNNKFYTSLSSYRKIIEEVDKIGLINKDDGIDAHIFTNKQRCIVPNLRDNNGYVLSPLLIFNFDNYDDNTIDHKIVHELNHIFELYLTNIFMDKYEGYCGWDYLEDTISQERVKEVDTINNREKRKYELFNEIINELIAQDISKKMHQENHYIFDNPNNSQYQHTTAYDDTKFIVNDFYNEFKDTIIKSRRNGNINVIYEEVGKENFEELNSLFDIYFNNFSGFKIYHVLDDIKESKDTELTRIYYDLVNRKNKIMDKMRMTSASKKESDNNLTQKNSQILE